MKALHSLTNSCDFADLKFRLAEMRGTYHFGALSMGYVSFWRPYTNKNSHLAWLFLFVIVRLDSKPRRRGLHISRSRASARARSFRRSSSPQKTTLGSAVRL